MDEPFVLMSFLKAICTFQNQVFKHFCWISLITMKTRPFQGLLLILVCRQNFSSPDDWEGSQDMVLPSQGSSCVSVKGCTPHTDFSEAVFWFVPTLSHECCWKIDGKSWKDVLAGVWLYMLQWLPSVLSCTLLRCINGPFFSLRASFTQLILTSADETYSNGSMSIHAQNSMWSWNLSLEHLLLSLFQRWEFGVVDCNVSEGLWIVDQEMREASIFSPLSLW